MTVIKDHDKTGNVTLIEPKPAASPWPIISEESRAGWHEAQLDLASGYPADHSLVTSWYVAGWEAANNATAPGWVTDVKFAPACLIGHCWDCTWPPEACGCGHHRPGGRAPYGPVEPADPLPAVAEYLGIAKPAPVAERDPEEDAPAGRAVLDDDEPVTDATAVLLDIARKQEAAGEPDATAVIEPAKAETEVFPAATDGGEPA
jgi:hypothetical protein